MSRFLSRSGVALLCLASILSARAADETPAPFAAMGGAQPAVDLSGQVTLQGSISQALSRNFAVRIQQFTVFEAVDNVDIQTATFEPTFNANVNKSVNQQASDQISITTIPYSNYSTETASFTVNDTLLTGGTVALGYSLVRSDYTPSFGPPNPAYAGSPTITITQPLLQGAGTDYGRALIESARLGVKISNLNFRSTVLTMIFNVETTYYNLLYQREQYKVQADQLKQAQQLLDENTTKRETGVLTDLDVMNARAGVAAAKNQLLLDMQAVHNSEDSLLQLLGDREFTTTVGDVQFPDVGEPAVDFAHSYKLARDNGPNLAVVQATIDQFKLAALRARRNTLPELNVNGGYGYGSYTGSLSDSIQGPYNGYNWTAGVTLSIPWGMKAARATYHQAVSQVHSEQVAYDQADQALVVNIRAAVRGVETSIQTVHSSAENATYANKAYELTKAQFDAGLATSYLVLQAQNTLETARVSELQAKVNLLVAVANLRFFEGSSLQLYRINLPE
jgi:outer membrane protein